MTGSKRLRLSSTSRSDSRRQRLGRFQICIVLIAVAIVGRICVFRPGSDCPGCHFNRGMNAAWLGVRWVSEPPEMQEIAALTSDLGQRQVQYVFVYVSYLKPDGRFNSTYDYADEFVSGIKATNPHLEVQAWIGLPLDYVDLGDMNVRERIADFCVDLVSEVGFDGIHLDPEPIPTNDENVLALLDEIRGALGSTPTFSIATRRIWPIFPDMHWPLIGQVAWRASYYREISQRVDQIAVMTYDSAMPFGLLYRQWVQFQVIEISRAVDGTGVQVFFGIPTSEEKTVTHWPCAENMESGLEGVIDGLNDAEARPAVVTGVAIYPYWETDETEWYIYEELWLGQSDVEE